jgi:hypothetical protein
MAAPSVGDQLVTQAAALPSEMAARVLPPLTERPDVPGLAPAVAAARGILADHAVVCLTVAGSAYTRPRSVLLFAPPDFPASRPKIRFIGVLQHVQVRALVALCARAQLLNEWAVRAHQVSELGFVEGDLFFSDDNLPWRPGQTSLSDVVGALRGMLSAPLKESLPTMSDEELFHEHVHEERGLCSFKMNVPPEEVRAAAVRIRAEFPDRLRARFAHLARLQAGLDTMARRHTDPVVPELFAAAPTDALCDRALDPEFRAILARAKSGAADLLKAALTEEAPGVYSFPVLQPAFCDLLMRELAVIEASDLPKRRPNSMNNYGLILNDLMEPLMDRVLHELIVPLARLLFPLDGGASLDSHHSFIVEYRPDADTHLDMHTDDAEVTLNVCISRTFTGGALAFCGLRGAQDHRVLSKKMDHVQGRGVLHLGIHRHGALDVESGHRANVIVWCRSCKHRFGKTRAGRHAHELPPDPVCISRTHDGGH